MSQLSNRIVAASVALVLAGAALSEEVAESKPAEELSEVTVTGSRIRRAVGMETPTPVTAITLNELKTMSGSSITEALVQLPQFFNSSTAENFGGAGGDFFTSPGGGSLNLRGVGSSRTLTLLDGRRMPPASIFGGPDISTFPDQLLQRVDSITGGASAAYGTDAVSGVVNYILDTNFEGVRANAQFGHTDRGDGANEKYSFAIGHALSEKTHLLFSMAHSKQSSIDQLGDRDWYQSCGLLSNSAAGAGTSQSNPLNVAACNLRSRRWSIDGVLNPIPAATGAGATLGRVTFDANGQAVPFRTGSQFDSNNQVGGSGEDTAANVLNVLLPKSQRSNAFAYVDHDFSDNLNVYVQGIYGKQLLERKSLPGAYGPGELHALTIYQDNAFLPQSISSYMAANNIASLEFRRQLSPADGVFGKNSDYNKEKVGTIGFKSKLQTGGFLNDWALDGYFQYGTTNLDWEQYGGTRQDRIFMAVDAVRDPATGTIKCRVTVVSGRVPDCTPLNLFGRGNASAAAIDWVTGFDPGVSVTTTPWIASAQAYGAPYSYVGDTAKHRLVKLNQRVAEIVTSGDVYEGWGAGSIKMAFGANYRRESVDQRVQASQGNTAADPNYFPVWCNDAGFGAQCTAAVLQRQISVGGRPAGVIGVRGVPGGVATNLVETQFSNVPFIRGMYDVKELFNETDVPLVKDLPFLKSLSFNGAVRWAEYGGSGTIWSWKTGLDARFTDELRLRGTYSVDTRAGNISDRFDRTGGVASVIDKKVSQSNTTTTAITIVRGGNPEIKPEVGKTFTVGLVYRPQWLPGFDVSVDWLRVNLKDAIEAFTSQQIIDQCYSPTAPDVEQCAFIRRDPTTDAILFINESKQNIGKATFDGIDFEMGYTHKISLLGGAERLTARLFGTYLKEASTTNGLGVKTDNTGLVPRQYFTRKVNLMIGYTKDDFSWSMNGRYNNGGTINKNWNVVGTNGQVSSWNVADNHVGGSVYWDTRLSYGLSVGDARLEIFGNVQNLFDRDPPVVLAGGISQVSGGYDTIGRRYVMGIDLKF